MNGYIHKVYALGGEKDGIRFGYSTNSPKFDLDEIIKENPLHFSTVGHITLVKPVNTFEEIEAQDLCARFKIEADDALCLDVREFKEKSGPQIYMSCPEDYEQQNLEKRMWGQDVKTLGSLVIRTIRATSVKDNNLFLHACAVVEPDIKAIYIIGSDKDHAGKTPLVNELLRSSPNAKLLSTALRLQLVGERWYAYPQNWGAVNGNPDKNRAFTIIRKDEEESYKEYSNMSLLNLGFKKHEHPDNKYIPGDRILLSIEGYNDIIDLSDYKVFCISASGAARDRQKTGTKPLLKKDEMKQNMYGWWIAFRYSNLNQFGDIGTKDYDEKLEKKYKEHALELAENFMGKNNNFQVYWGNVNDARKRILIRGIKMDHRPYDPASIEWYRRIKFDDKSPDLATDFETHYEQFGEKLQVKIEDYLKDNAKKEQKPEQSNPEAK
ncbi:MAG: hypothetical protein V1839_00595 [archaeon]